MSYRFKPTENFWESFYELTASQKESTRRAWKIFKENPFDPRLRPHKIHRLSARFGRTIYAVDIEGDMRAVFYVERDCVVTVDIGTHDTTKRKLSWIEMPVAAPSLAQFFEQRLIFGCLLGILRIFDEAF